MIKINNYRFTLEFLKSYFKDSEYFIVVKVLDSSITEVIGLTFTLPVLEFVDHDVNIDKVEDMLILTIQNLKDNNEL